MTNEIRSVYVKLPADEARQRWERTGVAMAGLVLSLDGQHVDLHFIPAQEGCVIAAVPRAHQSFGRAPALAGLVRRFARMQPSLNLEHIARQLIEEAGQLPLIGSGTARRREIIP